MTITYPRALPTNTRMSEAWFDLLDNVAISQSNNGNFMNLSQTVDPCWRGTFMTGILERTERPVWSAWHKSLRGGLRSFIAYDVRHAAPLAYPAAKAAGDVAGGWNGLATVTGLGLSGVLGLSALPATFAFKAGDRLGLEQSGRYGYYEVIEDVTASGGVVSVTVAPFLHTGYFTTAAVCRVWRPVCQFLIDQSTWSESGTVENTSISFKAVQRL